MRATIRLIAFFLVVLPCCVCSVPGTEAADDVPSIAVIVAALRHQDLGADLNVRYTESYKAGQFLVDYHYVRTSEALSLERDLRGETAEMKANSPAKVSYDRSQNETRSVTNNAAYGSIRTGLDGTLAVQNLLDGARDPVSGGQGEATALYEAISRYGRVGTAMVDIDGHRCWPISIEYPAPLTDNNLLAYLDPSIGFNPRAVNVVDTPGRPRRIKDASFGDYREVAPGIWFPYEKVIGESTFTVTSLRTDLHPPKDDVIVQFPSGTKVNVNSKTVIEIP